MGNFLRVRRRKTYQFENLLVRGEYNSKDLVLTTPKSGCKALETDPLKDNLILPESFPSTTTTAEISGVQSFTAYHVCCQCKKKITLKKSTILTYHSCGLKQKLKSTIDQCYVNLYVQAKDTKSPKGNKMRPLMKKI